MSLQTDQILDGKYRIVRLLGKGGMGAVYEGEHLLIRRRVAIKVLHAESAANATNLRRFEREAQAAGQIGNDHILEVLDLGSLPGGERYIVMEYLDGETLGARIQRHGRLTPEQIAPIARQFLIALASAHAAGIIHRDLKPENIFILRNKAGRADFVKLIDFGVSRFSHRADEPGRETTRDGGLLGTPCYMSPEQARGTSEADALSDIYSCGVILFEAVTGKLPFDAVSLNDLMFKIALCDPPSALSVVPSLDPDFAWLIEHAMARLPSERFPSVQAFTEALDQWMRKNSLTGTLSQPPPAEAYPSRIPPAGDSWSPKKTGAAETWARSAAPQPVGRKRTVATLGAAGALIAAIVAAVLMRGPGVPVANGASPRAAPPESAAPSDEVLPTVERSAAAQSDSSMASGAPGGKPSASGSAAVPGLQRKAPGPAGSAPRGKPMRKYRDLGY